MWTCTWCAGGYLHGLGDLLPQDLLAALRSGIGAEEEKEEVKPEEEEEVIEEDYEDPKTPGHCACVCVCVCVCVRACQKN